MTFKEALSNVKVNQPPPSGQQNYQYFISMCEQGNMRFYEDFLRWYNNTDLVPTFEATQKFVDFHHKKRIDWLKLGYTLPNLAIICVHRSTTAKLYPFTESDKEFSAKIRKDMVGGPSIVNTRKTVVDEILFRDSTNLCETPIGIDAGQLRPCSMCQAKRTCLYTRWELDSESDKFKPSQNKTKSFEIKVMSGFQKVRSQCTVESFYTTGTQKKELMLIALMIAFEDIATQCLKLWDAIAILSKSRSSYCSQWKNNSARLSKERARRTKKTINKEKFQNVIEKYECDWWKLYR